MFPAVSLNRTVWRYAALPDYLRAIGAVAATVCAAAAIAFAYNRLDRVPRSLPILQLLAGKALLDRRTRTVQAAPYFAGKSQSFRGAAKTCQPPAALTVPSLAFPVTEAYLQAAAELVPGRIRVAGLVGCTTYTGQLVASYPVLGVPEDIERILNALDVHGIHADRIVVATRLKRFLRKRARRCFGVKSSRNIVSHFLAEDLGFEAPGLCRRSRPSFRAN